MALCNGGFFIETDERLNGAHNVERNAERSETTRIEDNSTLVRNTVKVDKTWESESDLPSRRHRAPTAAARSDARGRGEGTARATHARICGRTPVSFESVLRCAEYYVR